MALFMIRYGEIALKSPRVRNRFERALGSNMASRFAGSGKECRLEFERGRIFLWSDHEEYAFWVLSRTFGVVSFSQVTETTGDMQDILALAAQVSRQHFRKGMRFCIRARRSGQHRYTSMELAREAGSAVFLANEALEPKVDLTNPELEIFIDVRQNRAYVYTGNHPGPGGMPLGTQGRVLGLVVDSKDIAACWLIMKRGCRVMVESEDIDIVEPLKAWDPKIRAYPPEENLDLEARASKRRAQGICLGWGMDEFYRRREEVSGMGIPVFYPLMGMAGAEVRELMGKIRE